MPSGKKSKALSGSHFNQVALLIAATRQNNRSPEVEKAMIHMATHLASMYAYANPLFDRTRFLLTCGTHAKKDLGV